MALTVENLVMLDVECATKEEVIKMMAKKVADEGIAESYEEYLDSLMKCRTSTWKKHNSKKSSSCICKIKKSCTLECR